MKTISFEGKTHQFPDDASDDEIRSALTQLSLPLLPIPMEALPAMGQQFSQAGEKLGKALTLKGIAPPTFRGKGMLEEPATNLVEGLLQGVNAPFIGAGRAVGTIVQDIAQPILRKILPYEEGATESAAYLGAAADAAAQLGIPFFTSKAMQAVKPLVKNRFPLLAPRLAELEVKKVGQIQGASETAAQDVQNALALKKAGEQQAIGQFDVTSQGAAQDVKNALALKKAGEQEALGQLGQVQAKATTAGEIFQAERQAAEAEARTAAQLIQQETKKSAQLATIGQAGQREKFGDVGAGRFLEQQFPNAPTAMEAGGQFARVIFPQQKAATAEKFTAAYKDLFQRGDQVTVSPSNTEKAINGILKEGGPAAPALPTQAESFGGRLLGELGGEGAVAEEGGKLAAEVRRAIDKGNPLKTDEQVYQRILDRLTNPQGTGGVPTRISTDLLKEALEEGIAGEQTTGNFMRSILRVRAAKRAAYDAGKSNIARQFEVIEKGLLQDIKSAPQTGAKLKSDFDVLSGAYKRDYVSSYSYGSPMAKALEKFPEDVHQLVPAIIRPATDRQAVAAIKSAWGVVKTAEERATIAGSWLRGHIDTIGEKGLELGKALPRIWDAHLDPRNGNYVLRSAFGDRFKPMNDFMQSLKQARELDFANAAEQAVTNLLKNRSGSLQAIEAAQNARLTPFEKAAKASETAATRAGLKTQAALGRLQTQTAQEIGGINAAIDVQSKNVADTLRQLQTETGKDISQISKARDKLVGQIQKDFEASVAQITPRQMTGERLQKHALFHGALGLAAAVSGSPWGFKYIAGAGIMYMSAPTLAKIVNTVKGAELLTRAVRATPGTVQAIAIGSQIESLAKTLEGVPALPPSP